MSKTKSETTLFAGRSKTEGWLIIRSEIYEKENVLGIVSLIEVEKKSLLGVDPRRQKFVKHLIAAKNEYRIRSPFLREKLPVVQQLLHSDAKTDKQETLFLLQELRMLIEEHIGSDVEQLFGGI